MSKLCLILLGAPGAGKGSQAALIQKKLGIAHISTGDLLRAHVANETPLGIEAKQFMDSGELVPDELIFSMFFERIEGEEGILLDGFPRTVNQAEKLEERLTPITIHLSVDDETLLKRLTGRRVCSGCALPYHDEFSPPQKAGVCDQCGESLIQRSDDTLEVAKERLAVYHEKTAPLIEFYESRGQLTTLNAVGSKEAITEEILAATSPGSSLRC